MRQKIISLSLDTYELASKKANFSAWVRRKLLDEQRIIAKANQKGHQMYESYCEPCELWYDSSVEEKMLYFMCHECDNKCKYMGPSQ